MGLIKAWFRRGVGTSRGRRIALAFLLTPLVIVVVMIVSTLEDPWQTLVLALTSALWLLALLLIRLPNDADDDYADLRGWLRRWRILVGVPLTFVAVALILAFGGFWPGVLAVQASLLLWPFGLVLYQTRRFVSKAWRRVSWGLALVTAVLVVVIPVVTLIVANAFGATWSLWIAVGLFATPTILAFVALFWLNAESVERIAPAQMTQYAQTRSLEVDVDARARPRGGLAIASITCVVLSSFLLLASAVRVPIERRLIETSQVAERGPDIGGIPLGELDEQGMPAPERKQALYDRYYPVLRLTEKEKWVAYRADLALSAAFDVSPAEDCPERADSPCSEAAFEDELERLPDDAEPRKNARVFPAGAVYPRLIRVRETAEQMGAKLPAFAGTTEWIVQFWLFYPNNEWTSESAVGSLVQKHGGDWEWVGVGIDGLGAPLFVGYSAHCNGSWRPWRESASVAVLVDPARVLVGGDPKNPASHPLVIVAEGSHANYPTPGTREPDWGSCQFGGMPFAAQAMRWLTFITSAREATPDLGPFQVPAVLSESDTDRDARRALWWGKQGQTKFGPILIASDEHGPASPGYQVEPWESPLQTIFGWECDAGEDACKGEEETG